MNPGDLTAEELTEYVKMLGEKPFRAKQLYSWIHSGAESFDSMTNIPKPLREKLKSECGALLPEICRKYVSKLDGTVKYLFRLADGNIIESVVMDYHHGKSICVSSQVGCRMGCSFCASTLGGLVRSLTPFEIEGQLQKAQNDLGCRISNIVIMGIGEPLDNYENVMKFIRSVSSENGLNIGCRHITLSTCGIADKIYRLADEGLPFNLAISLHAPADDLRREMMPVARAYPLAELMRACDYWFEKTHRRITFEYALVKNKNSDAHCAALLAKLLQGKNCHVNLIPVNPVTERKNVRTSAEETEAFKRALEHCGINATVRRELGADINASCGQLRNNEIGKQGGGE